MYWMQLTPLGARSSESRYCGTVSQTVLHRVVGNRLGARHREHRAIAEVGAHRREAEAAVAEHHRGDAVPSRNSAPGIPSDLRVVVRVQIDESGRDDHTVGIDDFFRRAGRAPADLRDFAILDPDVAAKTWHPRSVNYGAAFDVKIEFRHCSLLDGKDNLNRCALSRWPARLIPRKSDSYARTGKNSNSISHRLDTDSR